MVDVRWVALVVAFILILILVKKYKEWSEPILVALAFVTVLTTLFFFVSAPVFVL